jgi:hypothetical protein
VSAGYTSTRTASEAAKGGYSFRGAALVAWAAEAREQKRGCHPPLIIKRLAVVWRLCRHAASLDVPVTNAQAGDT